MKKPLPLIRSAKSLAVSVLLIGLPYGLLFLPDQALLGPLSALYAVLLTLVLLPTALCIAAAVSGTAAMGLGLAAALAAVGLQVPFRKSCPLLIGVHVLALSAVYWQVQRLAGGDLYTAAGNAVVDFLKSWELGDTMLYQLYSMGMISLPEEMAQHALLPVLGGYRLSPAARADLLLSAGSLTGSALQSLVPNLLMSQSILGGVACLLLPLRFGFLAEEKRAFKRPDPLPESEDSPRKVNFPDLGMPPFSRWHLPRGIGWQVGAALALGYILRLQSPSALGTAGVLLYAAASAVFTIQGAAAVNFLQRARGTRRFWRVAVPLLLMMTRIPLFVGIFDQLSNFRGLRRPPETKEGL